MLRSKRFLKRLFNIGIQTGNGAELNGKIRLSNRLSTLLFCIAAPYSVIFYTMNLTVPTIVVLAVTSLYAGCIYLNYKGRYTWSNSLIIFNTAWTLFYYSAVLGKESGVQLVYFSAIILPMALFGVSRIRRVRFFVVFLISCFVGLDLFGFNLIQSYDLSAVEERLIHYTAVFATFSIAYVGVFFVFTQYEKNKESLRGANIELRRKNEDLEKANLNVKEKIKLETEYKLAREFQKQYLPSVYPYKGIFPSIIHYPSIRMVSGDFYDVRAVGHDDIGYFLMDVAGKGIESSYVAIQLHQILRQCLKGKQSPRRIMEILNQEVKGMNMIKKMCAGAYISFDPIKRTISYCRAGLDVLCIARGEDIIDLDVGNPPLGFGEMNEFIDSTFNYQTGDVLIASTDGIIDAKNEHGDMYREDSLLSVLMQAVNCEKTNVSDAILQSFHDFVGATTLQDDVTLLTFELS